MPPCKIVPLLADAGKYLASASTFYRILRAENQLVHRQASRPVRKHRPKSYSAYGPNQVWTWDISYILTRITGVYFYLYSIIDIYSRKIVGFSVHEQESSNHAACLITQSCIEEGITEQQLVLHSDNGSPMKGATMLATLEKLGVIPSFSRPAVSDDHPYSEALFRTVKYHPTFPMMDKFLSIVAARQWSEKFVAWYNQEHLHSGLKFVTPQQRHNGQDKTIMLNRHKVYELAKAKHPERWSGQTRNWLLPDSVSLNPNNNKMQQDQEASRDNNLEQLPEQERLDGASDGRRQATDVARQYGHAQLL